MWGDISKILNTVSNDNPNRKADEFVNAIKRELGNDLASLEIIWVTTNFVKDSLRKDLDEKIQKDCRKRGWRLKVEFSVVDKNFLDSVIFDVNHGYIPYTGLKEIPIVGNTYLNYTEGGISAIVCSVNVHDILKWFNDEEEVKKFLQRNVREFLGENRVNKRIKKSFEATPEWFWYKHNGIMIFADHVYVNEERSTLTLKNPQIVNGGQTLISLYKAYDKDHSVGEQARVLVRAYKLPYEDRETYSNSIEIIRALNTQNNIYDSDLHSSDPRQVRLEDLLKGFSYSYYRKRSEEAKTSKYGIKMRDLALRYLVCNKYAPQEGVRGNPEEIFSETSKYDDVFPEEKINKELSKTHPVLEYIMVWSLYEMVRKIGRQTKRDRELLQYSQHFVAAFLYNSLREFIRNAEVGNLAQFSEFLNSEELSLALAKYIEDGFKVCRAISEKSQDPRAYFKSKESVTAFDKKVSGQKQKLIKEIENAWKNFKAKWSV